MLVRLDDECGIPMYVKTAGYEYFLEISTIKDEVLGGRNSMLNQAQRFAVVLYYAQHDAWPRWFFDLCEGNGCRGA